MAATVRSGNHKVGTLKVLMGACLVAAAPHAVAQPATGAAVGTVFTTGAAGTRLLVPDAHISISGPALSRQTVADQQAEWRFPRLAPGQYRVEAGAPGLAGASVVTVSPGVETSVSIELRVAAVQQSATVTGDAGRAATDEMAGQATIGRTAILNSPNKDDRIDSVLPLIPGVVRGPDGLIDMKGAPSSQGGALINSASVTDPVTGNFATTLPVDVVQSVTVVSNPCDPQYGRMTGAVSSVETAAGNFDGFHITAQNLVARPRSRGGDIVGIESWTPRIAITGPIVKNKIAITQSFEYRFIRTPVSSLPPLSRDPGSMHVALAGHRRQQNPQPAGIGQSECELSGRRPSSSSGKYRPAPETGGVLRAD